MFNYLLFYVMDLYTAYLAIDKIKNKLEESSIVLKNIMKKLDAEIKSYDDSDDDIEVQVSNFKE